MLTRALTLALALRFYSTLAWSQNIRDFDTLQTGQTYRSASEYCRKESDLRQVLDLHQSSGYQEALVLWKQKTRVLNICIEDPLTVLTEFKVVRLVGTYNFGGTTLHIIEVMIGGLPAFAISPIPVVPSTSR